MVTWEEKGKHSSCRLKALDFKLVACGSVCLIEPISENQQLLVLSGVPKSPLLPWEASRA